MSSKSSSQSLDPNKVKLPGGVRLNRKLVMLVGIGAGAILFVFLIFGMSSGGGGEEKQTSTEEANVAEDVNESSTEDLLSTRRPEGNTSWEMSEEDKRRLAETRAARAAQEQAEKRGQTPPKQVDVPYSQRYNPEAYKNAQQGGEQSEEESQRAEAYRQALTASPLVASGGAPQRQSSSRNRSRSNRRGAQFEQFSSSPDTRTAQEAQEDYMTGYLKKLEQAREAQQAGSGGAGGRGATRGRGGAGPSGGVPGRSGFQERATADASRGVYIASNVNDPISEWEIKAGTVVPAVLETQINTDLPGEIKARVMRPVYDFFQREVLIPPGTLLLGSYDSQITFGQSRALVAWTRMIFPNGQSVKLPGLAGKTLSGANGLQDQVNRHYGRLFASAAAVALVGAGVQLASPDQAAGPVGVQQQQSARSVIARQISLELSRIATKVIERQMDVPPTLTVRKGYRFHVYFNRDLAFEEPYQQRRPSPRFQKFGETNLVRARRDVYTAPVTDSTWAVGVRGPGVRRE